MTFSRGLFSGWMHGVDHQRLVSARYGKKRGPLAGRIARVGRDFVELARRRSRSRRAMAWSSTPAAIPMPSRAGASSSGAASACSSSTSTSISRACSRATASGRPTIPALSKTLRQTFAGTIAPRRREPIDLRVTGRAGEPLRGAQPARWRCVSAIPLQAARTAPLTTERLREHLGRFGESPLCARRAAERARGRSHPADRRAEPPAPRARLPLEASQPARGRKRTSPGASSRRAARNEPATRRAASSPCSAARSSKSTPPRGRRAHALRRFRGHPPLPGSGRRARAAGADARSCSPRRASRRRARRAFSG